MVHFVPFSGCRYDLSQVGVLSEVIAPPPCLISPELQDRLYQRHPCNTIRLIRNREEPGDESPHDCDVRSDDFLRLWKREAILIREHHAAFYVCQHRPRDAGDERSVISVIGRIRLSPTNDGSIQFAAPPDQNLVNRQLDLLRQCRTQFSPVQAVVLNSDSASAEISDVSLFDDLAARLQSIPPFELTDESGADIRIWAVTDHAMTLELQSRLPGRSLLIADGAEQVTAAILLRDELAAAGQLTGENDDAGFVMVSLMTPRAADVSVLPVRIAIPNSETVDSDTLLKLCEPDFTVQHVGRESFAVRDACELAQLNDGRPAVAVGIQDGSWYLVTGGSAELSEPANTARLRLSLARQLSLHLSRQLQSNQPANHMHQTDLVEQLVIPELNAVGCSSGIGVSRNGLKILVPSATVSELAELSSMAASSDVFAGADLPPVCLLPFPPSGWVYYSFGRSNVT
jgi:hypothetical protein